MIYPITAADLDEDHLCREVYPDPERTFYWTDCWDPDFYVALARAGFISIAHPHPAYGPLLLPELQASYAILDWEDLHVSRQMRSRIRPERLEADGIELVLSPSCARVTERLRAYHGPRAWLCEPYLDLLAKLSERKRGDFILHGVELWCRQRSELVAGELGYTIGTTYTSLSGFCSRQDRQRRSTGTLQMVLLAQRLREQGYAFWNMGHPHMSYKRALGAREVPRSSFLERWRLARTQAPGAARRSTR
jgi:Leu/Phe-tRNA-protein transferase